MSLLVRLRADADAGDDAEDDVMAAPRAGEYCLA